MSLSTFLCLQNNKKSCGQIWMEFLGNVNNYTRNKRSHFGGDWITNWTPDYFTPPTPAPPPPPPPPPKQYGRSWTLALDLYYFYFYVAFNSQGHIAICSLQVEEPVHMSWSRFCTVNHWQVTTILSNMKRPGRDSNRRPQRLKG